jgi:hypothetical protein
MRHQARIWVLIDSSTDVLRALLVGERRSRSLTDAAPVNPAGRWSWPAKAFLITPWKKNKKGYIKKEFFRI